MDKIIKSVKKIVGENKFFGQFSIVGIGVKVNEDFVPFLIYQCEQLGIDHKKIFNEKENIIHELFEEIRNKKKFSNDLIWICGVDLLMLKDDEIIVGMSCSDFNENFSRKRIFIEVFDELCKLGLFDEKSNKLEDLIVYNDFIILEEETKNEEKAI